VLPQETLGVFNHIVIIPRILDYIQN
jgi:hypothetical protein